jgi:hypothetical protein
VALAAAGDAHRREVGESAAGGFDQGEQAGDVDTAVGGPVGLQASGRLLQLPLAADAVPTAGLVPRDGDVDEALEEVALGRLGRAPDVLEDLVGGEVLAAVDEREPALELRRRP